MITSLIFFISGIYIRILWAVLSVLTYFVPPQIKASFIYFMSYTRYLGGFIDFAGMMPAFIAYITFLSAWFTFVGLMWGWHKMPWVGKSGGISDD